MLRSGHLIIAPLLRALAHRSRTHVVQPASCCCAATASEQLWNCKLPQRQLCDCCLRFACANRHCCYCLSGQDLLAPMFEVFAHRLLTPRGTGSALLLLRCRCFCALPAASSDRLSRCLRSASANSRCCSCMSTLLRSKCVSLSLPPLSPPQVLLLLKATQCSCRCCRTGWLGST